MQHHRFCGPNWTVTINGRKLKYGEEYIENDKGVKLADTVAVKDGDKVEVTAGWVDAPK